MMDKIVIGKILKPQGICGELKILPITSHVERFYELKYVYIGEATEHTKVLSVRINGMDVFCFFDHVIDRTMAEKLRGLTLSVPREEAFLEEGAYFICDLLLCDVYLDDGELVGHMFEVLQQSGADTYWVKKKDCPDVLFPAIDDVFESIDVENHRIVVKKSRFAEVACYED